MEQMVDITCIRKKMLNIYANASGRFAIFKLNLLLKRIERKWVLFLVLKITISGDECEVRSTLYARVIETGGADVVGGK